MYLMILNYVYCCNSVVASVSYTIAYRMASKGKSDHPFLGLCTILNVYPTYFLN